MKKLFKKTVTALVALVVALSAGCLTGCKSEIDKIAETKSILNVRYYSGGLGEGWINEVKSKFEDMFKDVSFEDGKTGVYVNITADKNFDDIELTVASGADKNDIYYTPDTNLYEHIGANVCLNVTDIFTEKVYDADGSLQLAADGKSFVAKTESMRDRANDMQKDIFNTGTTDNPAYMGIPYADCISGFVVDYDLFEEEGWNDYDGLNGLPDTIEDLEDLFRRIQRAGYSGFTYSVDHYARMLEQAIVQKVDGDAGTALWNTYEGDYDFNGDGVIDADEHITPQTAYRLLDTRGYKAAYDYAALAFTRDSQGNSYYDANVMQGVTYTGAQSEFLMSKTYTDGRNRIAMIVEGDWWENEARGVFTSMGQMNENDGYGKRDFRFMPIPRMTDDDECDEYTMASHSGSGEILFVNRLTVENSPLKKLLSKLWIQYQYSAEGCRIYTKNSGSVLPYEYDMGDDYDSLTPFAKSVWEMHHSEDVKIVHRGAMSQSFSVRNASQQVMFNASVLLPGGTSRQSYSRNIMFENARQVAQQGRTFTWEQWIEGAKEYTVDKIIAATFPTEA